MTGSSDPERYAADPLRPQYHFTPYQGWINDPNGLVHWRGRHQLFAQCYPDEPRHGPMHWAHADSPDGVHWRNLPIALAPPPPATPDDRSGIWSGNAVDDNGTLTVFYTIFNDVAAHPGATPEMVGLATSTDGVTFRPDSQNPVIERPPAGTSAGFGDPYVFRSGGRWNLVIGSGHDGAGNVQLYTSDDLRHWEHRGVLATGDGSTGGMWECPSFFPLGDAWGLLVSANHTVYTFVGTFDGTRFTARTQGVLDAGPHFYAAQHYRDDRGRDLVIAWLHRWDVEVPTVAHGWSGTLSINRELFLRTDGTLGSRPIDAVETLRIAGSTVDGRHDLAAGTTVPAGRGTALDLELEVEVARSTASDLAVRLRASAAESTELRYDFRNHRLTLDTTRSGQGDGGTWSATVRPDAAGRLTLRVLLDRSTVEVFGSDGTALSALIYPRYDESDRVELAASGGVRIARARSWRMESCWR